MKKRNFLAILLCLVMLFTAACNPAGGPPGTGGGNSYTGKEIELRVWNISGGAGQKWLTEAKTRFENLYKDREFSNGKVGVKVYTEPKHAVQVSELADTDFSVFFTEGVDINVYAKSGKLLPITDIVTATSTYDEKSIESKLSEETQKALKASDGENYYVLPHYQSYEGVTYNKSFFDEYGFYFVENVPANGYTNASHPSYGFVKEAKKADKTVRTVGPNGIRGDYDDGLPSSLEELERLCKYVKEKGIAPFACWDAFNHSYSIKFVNALWTNLEGYDGALAQFTFDSNGTPVKIVTSVGESNETGAIFDERGNITTDEVVITRDNAYLVYQQESKYQTLRFSNYLFNQANHNLHDSFWQGKNNSEIHVEFMYGAAMMIEGTYWRNEATDAYTFNDYPELLDIETAYMPLPVQVSGSVTEGNGKAPTVIDIHSAYGFINANVEAKHGTEVAQLAKEFLQFCYSDVELAEFTRNSTMCRDLEYSIGDASDPNSVYSSLSSYSQSTWDIKKYGKVVNPISAEPEYINNPGEFHMTDQHIWATKFSDGNAFIKAPDVAFRSGSYTVKQYFDSMKKDANWWNNLER